MLRIIRKIFFFAARYNINILLFHIAGCLNVDADLLSRLQVLEFRQRNVEADVEATLVPEDVWLGL